MGAPSGHSLGQTGLWPDVSTLGAQENNMQKK